MQGTKVYGRLFAINQGLPKSNPVQALSYIGVLSYRTAPVRTDTPGFCSTQAFRSVVRHSGSCLYHLCSAKFAVESVLHGVLFSQAYPMLRYYQNIMLWLCLDDGSHVSGDDNAIDGHCAPQRML